MKILIGGVIFLSLILICINLGPDKNSKKQEEVSQEFGQEPSISDVLLLNKNLKSILNVHKEITLKQKNDTNAATEIWLVPNGMSIPNYMLRASREIERCKGKVHWMKEIKYNRALLKYEGEQGVYPLTEIRVIDSLWLPNSSKLAVVLAVNEKNQLLKNKPELLEKLNYTYNLLILSSRPEHLEIGKKLNANLIPWIPMESSIFSFSTEKSNQIKIGITEKELTSKLDEALKKFNNASGFASFNGEDFLAHDASVEHFGNVLRDKKLWFWDLTKRNSASLSQNECARKNIRFRKDYLDEETEAQVTKALEAARKSGRSILLFALTEKSINLLKNLPEQAEKQGTRFVSAEEVF
ncbi:MAG: divergent polysaccharide deacetylase family protein [Fibromonadaceae bacterium]|nr:divergent polysaccharide deacetylase family protein [Fibromonadaceae bacterium]